jgi:beta-galactosidase
MVRRKYYAPVEFDWLMGNHSYSNRAAGIDRLERKVLSFEFVQISPKAVQVRICAHLSGAGMLDGIDSEVVYRVFGNSEIILENKVLVHSRLPYLPRIGLEMILPRAFDHLTWYGRGPHENYVDRKHGAALGIYDSPVTDQYTPYVFPSECGGKEDVRWLALTDTDGTGLMVTSLDKLHIDALHFSIQDLEKARHTYDLVPRQEVILHLDGWHMGVGGDDGWWCQVHPEFLITPGKYHFGLRMRAVSSKDDLSALARTQIQGVF